MARIESIVWLPPMHQLSPRFSMATPGAVPAPSPLPAVIESPNAATTRMSFGRRACTLDAGGKLPTYKLKNELPICVTQFGLEQVTLRLFLLVFYRHCIKENNVSCVTAIFPQSLSLAALGRDWQLIRFRCVIFPRQT